MFALSRQMTQNIWNFREIIHWNKLYLQKVNMYKGVILLYENIKKFQLLWTRKGIKYEKAVTFVGIELYFKYMEWDVNMEFINIFIT